MVGMVSTVSAVNRRFMVINEVGWTSINIYASYTDDEETAITAGWPGTAMTKWKEESGKNVWYVDLDIPSTVSTIKVTFNNGNDGGANQTWDYKDLDISSEDKLFYIYDESGDNNNHGISPVTLSYYISGWKEGESDHSDNFRQILTFNTNGTYTCDLDLTSYTANGNRCIFPFFASGESDGHPWVDWNFCIRPQYSTAQIPFENKNSTMVWDGSQCWTFQNQVHYDCTFNFSAGTWDVKPYFERTISSLGYATFSSTYDVDVEGATATYITGVGANNVLTEASFTDGIKANTGALLYKVGGGTATFTPAASTPTDVSSTNKLVAVSSDITSLKQSANGYTNYILTNNTTNGESIIGFYKANSDETNTVAAGKAYLSLSNDIAPAREFLTFGEVNVTGIAAPKFVKNLNGYYNLNGQRIAQPSKGLYIVNGKKVMVK